MAVRRRPLLICFTGMDGGGKTTQAAKLADTMRARGIPTRYVQNRYGFHLTKPIFAIARFLFLRRKNMHHDYVGYAAAKRGALNNPLVSGMFQRIVVLDYVLQTLWRVKLPMVRGQSIVCDRYIYDTVVDLVADLDRSETRARAILRAFQRFAPKPDLTFLIDLDEEIAFARKDDTPAPEYLRERRNTYLELANRYGAMILDGCEDQDALEQIIGGEVEGVIKPRKGAPTL